MIEKVGKHIYARLIPSVSDRKTSRWIICAYDGEIELGEVKWLGKWRCYCYFPLNDTLYERQCLRDIASFCESRTTEHNAELRERSGR